MLPCNPPPQETPRGANETVFKRIMCDYVFMFFAPSFLRSWAGAVTRIRKSSYRRLAMSRAGHGGDNRAGQEGERDTPPGN